MDIPIPVFAEPRAVLVIRANGGGKYASLVDNESARAFVRKLNPAEETVVMSDRGGFVKAGELPWALPESAGSPPVVSGDLILYENNQIAVYRGGKTTEYSKLASVGRGTEEELAGFFGEGDVTVSFSLEWSE